MVRIAIDCCQQGFPSICTEVRRIHNIIISKMQEIWERILRAYQEPSKHIPKLVIPLHPIPNTYPKHYKKVDWPKYLDNAWGAWYANPDEIDDIAHKVEPLENVTALHAVSLGNNEKGMYRLVADGGIMEALDIRGQTPAYWAAYKGNLKMLMKLKIYGADLNHKDFRGKTPLRAAVKYGQDKVITFLATHKVNLNELDGRGLTPLHLAAYLGNFSAYQKLIYFGADRTIVDPLGRTAEEILNMKYAEIYHHRWFIGRVFSSPTPPPLSLGPWKIQKLAART
ncbi:MAG: ankyrin repeat domain-containing protein [Chlamydiales bacterium]